MDFPEDANTKGSKAIIISGKREQLDIRECRRNRQGNRR
jgi:hypothetical protein